jgi:hypothetical protein
VEELFSNELQELRDPSCEKNVFYSKIHGRDICVHGELICSLMDQPKHRGANSMVGGNSLYGVRWGYSVNLQEIHLRLVPCGECQEKLLSGNQSWNEKKCGAWAQWEMIRDDNFLYWKAPKGFPVGVTCIDGFLWPESLIMGFFQWLPITRISVLFLVSGAKQRRNCFFSITALTRRLLEVSCVMRRTFERWTRWL